MKLRLIKIMKPFAPFLIIPFAVAITNLYGQGDFDYQRYLLERQLPEWFMQFYNTGKIDSNYSIADYINPFYIEGDFNGDQEVDIAVLIEESGTDKKGIMICHAQTGDYYILGAGNSFGNGGDDFSWMNIWKVYRKTRLEPGVGEAETVSVKNDAIWVEKSESASAVIYWTGKTYRWYQQGD